MIIENTPKIEIGISVYTDDISSEIEEDLKGRQSLHGKCESCGVSITNEMCHHLHSKGGWYNVCGMCYFPNNLDKIDYYRKGSVVFLPTMSQQRVNAFLRGIWCINYLSRLDQNNDELLELVSTFDELEKSLAGTRNVTESYFKTSEPDVISSMLFLITPEEYAQRYKLFNSFVWLPDVDHFTDEIAYWAQEEYNALHPEKIGDNIKNFISQNMPMLKAK